MTSIDADGVITGAVAATSGETSRCLGIRLDGRFGGTLLAEAADRLTLSFRWALPDHLLADRFALVELDRDGGIEAATLDLRAHFRLETGEIGVDGGVIRGWFATDACLAEQVDVVFRDGATCFAQGLARRGPDGRHHFALSPNHLLPVGTIALLTPSIGGLELPSRMLRVLPMDLGVLGGVGEMDDTHVSGWVAATGAMPDVALVQHGRIFDTARPRPDATDLRGTFRLRRPPAAGGAFTVVLAGSATQLCGSPVQPAPALAGFVERVSRNAAHGWARDPTDPSRRLVVEAVVDGRVLARAEADSFRGDVAEAGHGDGHCGFRLDLSAHALELGDRVLAVRVADTGQMLAGTPRVIAGNAPLLRFLDRANTIAPAVQARLGRMMDHRWAGRGVSVVLRVGDTPPARLRAMLHSLHRQWCGRWEALCVADAAPASSLAAAQDAARRDARIRLLATPQDTGLAEAMNFGLRAATFDQVLFLNSPACLEPDAVHHLLTASVRPALLYWDEAVTHTDRGITDAVCRGAFSPDLFRSRPDFGTGFCLPAAVAREVGGWRDGPAAAVEFLDAVLGRVAAVGHIPRILARLDIAGATVPGDGRTILPPMPPVPLADAAGAVLIVIPTHNALDLLRRCLDSIRATAGDVEHRIVVIDHRSDDPATRRYLARLGRRATVMRHEGPFNYAAMNNLAVRRYAGDARFVLFLNNDTEALHPGWLQRLRRLAARPRVGAVGALLLYPDLRVQHAGVVLGVGGAAGHAFAFDAAYRDGVRLPGPQGLLTALRDVSAVTAACMMMPVAAFDAVGGFDERFPVGFNDTDLCLRLRRHGERVLYDGQTVLLHHESRTRRQTGQLLHRADTNRFKRRWQALLRAGDPYYSPYLSLIAADWELREDCVEPRPARFTNM